ncbi:FecR family protein [Aestuariibaculum marinum]|uniref:FecR family protein n=1 Tax=Aestuariibaculum marinum TaxID=2683592 RepID=A0A8J6PZG4_9FLAO|nr:FecR family protein [Aestuariibaculum marinum]MBD0825383.1 FecR family protein [Aestuariibaculum marinum]
MKNLIVKYLTDTISKEELEILLDWLEKDKNKKKFEKFVRENYNINMLCNDIDEVGSLERVKQVISDQNKVFKIKRWYYVAAAVLVGVMMSGYLFKNVLFDNELDESPIISSSNIKIGSDRAILTLETGETIQLEEGVAFNAKNASSDGKQIAYNKNASEELVYNILTIPRGGQFFIKLSDGTQVWLNSDSKLRYPVKFIEGKSREVELLYGEAYFDVTPSSENKGARFKVINRSQEVEVLGTEFNIKAYNDESNIYTTLVEGKVEVSSGLQKQNLLPNQQANLNVERKTIEVQQVLTYNEVSWKDGVFSFEGKSLKEITKVMSRWYDVDFVFENQLAEGKRFNGALKKNVKIDEILEIIRGFGIIENYEVINKTIVLK